MRCSLLFIGQQIIRSEVEASEILMILRSSYNKRCILIQKAVMTSVSLSGWELATCANCVLCHTTGVGLVKIL